MIRTKTLYQQQPQQLTSKLQLKLKKKKTNEQKKESPFTYISMASDTELQLLQLCTDGNLSTVKDLITKQGLDPIEVKDPSGLTLLHLACQHGHLDIAQYLIKDQKCNPETTTPNGRIPLHVACKSGHLHIVKCLIIDHKCNPHCTGRQRWLHSSACSQ